VHTWVTDELEAARDEAVHTKRMIRMGIIFMFLVRKKLGG